MANRFKEGPKLENCAADATIPGLGTTQQKWARDPSPVQKPEVIMEKGREGWRDRG